MRDLPQRIEIELSNRCNLKCSYCPRRYLDDTDGLLNYDLFRKIMDQVQPYPDTIIVLHRRGESLLHPEFIDMLYYVKGKFKEIQLATNATVMDAAKSKAMVECLNFVSFSLDLPNRYNTIRGADYNKVLENINYFLSINKDRVRTQASMVKTDNVKAKDIEEFKDIWARKVERIRIYQEHSANGSFGSLKEKRGERVSCIMPFYELLVYYDGKVGRCNHDWSGEPMGDLNKNTIKEIWNSDGFTDLRSQHKKLLFKDKTCKNCDSWYPKLGEQGTGETIE